MNRRAPFYIWQYRADIDFTERFKLGQEGFEMIGWICLAIAAGVVATVWHFRESVHALVEGVFDSPNAYGIGAGTLAAVMLSIETAHNLMVYTYVAPAAVVLTEYQERQRRVLQDLSSNRPEEELNADFEALNRSAAKAQAMARLGTALIAH